MSPDCTQSGSELLRLPPQHVGIMSEGATMMLQGERGLWGWGIIILWMLVAEVALGQVSPHGNLKIPCESCHETDSWKMRNDPAFKHEHTGFVLTGQHKAAKCESCHRDLKFAKQNANCISCHTDVHRSELGSNCFRCHTTESWQVPDMIHKHQQTRFPLMGRHQTVPCQACHSDASQQEYVGTPTTCVGCHRTDYQEAKNPDHVTAQFSTDCSGCHQVTAFSWGGSFDHAATGFPLTGAHKAAQCGSCHVNNKFTNLSTDCYQCHQVDFQQTTNPSHASGNFSHDCTQCHTTSLWQPATFNHGATGFPLTGAHASAQCQSCHTNGNYQLAYTNCYQCHQTDFVNAANPNHVAGNFNHDCTQCHSTTNWTGATFDHGTTRFPLTGAHVAVQCQTCHVNGNYQLVYTDCYQCHQTDFTNATNPNHVAGTFSHDCTQCHSTTNWTSATFNHSTTRFPLTGAHSSVQCQSCHVNGNYQLVYTDCYQCHQTDFQQVSNPNHVSQQFPHDCTTCHSTTVWTPNTMNHDAAYFRIYSGHHGGAWTQCSQCHTTIGNLNAWSCTTGCHQTAHNQGQNCYSCHRNA